MKKEAEKELYKEFGKYLADISKLIFGGVVLTGIMREEVGKVGIMLFEVFIYFASALCAFVCLYYIKKEE